MDYRFTNRLCSILALAREHASETGREAVDRREVLHAILVEGNGVACQLLEAADVDLLAVRAVLRWSPSETLVSQEEIPFTEDVKEALLEALSVKRWLEDYAVGTEHLLLGMLRQDRQLTKQDRVSRICDPIQIPEFSEALQALASVDPTRADSVRAWLDGPLS